MRTSPTAAPARPLLISALILLAAVIEWTWFHLFTRIRLEDALITYRYARNLAGGVGFVYNEGERILGTTTPLYTLVLGLAGAVLGPDFIPIASNVLMAVASAAAALLTGKALRRLGFPEPLSWIAAASVCQNPQIVWMTCGGMETPLVLMLMAAGLWALSRGFPVLAAAAAGLLILTRIDGALFAAGIYVVILLRDRRAFLRAALGGALVVAPWTVFAFVYFGTPFPHSIVAKRIIGAADHPFGLDHAQAFVAWATPSFGAILPGAWPAGFVIFILGAVRMLRRKASPESWLVVTFPFAFSLALYLGRSPLYFDWYLAPVLYCSLIVGSAGAWSLVEGALRLRDRLHGPALIALGLALATCLVMAAREMGGTAVLQRDYQINEDGTRRAVGEWLASSTPRDAVVAMEAIGYQGYYSDRRVIDLAGLVSPQMVRLRRQSWSNAEAFHRMLQEMEPDYLVLRSFEVDRNVHYHGGRLFETDQHIAYFASRYEEARRFAAPLPEVWGPTSYLTVYRRTNGTQEQ